MCGACAYARCSIRCRRSLRRGKSRRHPEARPCRRSCPRRRWSLRASDTVAGTTAGGGVSHGRLNNRSTLPCGRLRGSCRAAARHTWHARHNLAVSPARGVRGQVCTDTANLYFWGLWSAELVVGPGCRRAEGEPSFCQTAINTSPRIDQRTKRTRQQEDLRHILLMLELVHELTATGCVVAEAVRAAGTGCEDLVGV